MNYIVRSNRQADPRQLGSWFTSFVKCGKTNCPDPPPITVDSISKEVVAILQNQPTAVPYTNTVPQTQTVNPYAAPTNDINSFLASNKSLLLIGGIVLGAIVLTKGHRR